MKGFICVYQHPDPPGRDRKLTAEAAARDPALEEFLSKYDQPDCFYDWGDDPGFFAATKIFGDSRAATWGVCRRDVRAQLHPGDFVVWFCAKSGLAQGQCLSYFLIGCSTVIDTVDRYRLWTDECYAPYRSFYNTLACPRDGRLEQHETFHEFHDDWEKRASAPYLLFDRSPARSSLNLSEPLLVAERAPGEQYEVWRSARDPKVAELERLLFIELGINRRLRTGNLQRPHRQIALHRAPAFAKNAASRLDLLRDQLIGLTMQVPM